MVPGHTRSSAAGEYSIPQWIRRANPLIRLLEKFIAEMAILFPDRFFHIGGDEVNGKQWDANPKIQEFMRAHKLKNDQELQQYFTDRVQKIVSKHHKIMVGWDEILTPGMPKDIVIQSWRGQDSLAEAAQAGIPRNTIERLLPGRDGRRGAALFG